MILKGKMLVKGHTLYREGQSVNLEGVSKGMGACSCGARSPKLTSNRARQQWHQQHKLDVQSLDPLENA